MSKVGTYDATDTIDMVEIYKTVGVTNSTSEAINLSYTMNYLMTLDSVLSGISLKQLINYASIHSR